PGLSSFRVRVVLDMFAMICFSFRGTNACVTPNGIRVGGHAQRKRQGACQLKPGAYRQHGRSFSALLWPSTDTPNPPPSRKALSRRRATTCLVMAGVAR